MDVAPAVAERAGVVVVAAAILLASLVAGGPGSTAVASRPGTPASVVLDRGETLWDLAERHAPAEVDPRAYVDALVRLNGLTGPPRAGENIDLPD